MIIKPTREELLARGQGKYSIVIGTAKRARQIAQGSPKLTNAKMESDVTTAAIEIAEDKVIIKK
ncbi:MAG: DNA-directed RNA polymerase subunit omega [Clostridia bacterium]|jgi:DNA-directed RNA polymerase subunit omega|nr:DNA-directed RNA polymerase subunit omega [Clostridia bacterium]